MRFAAEGARSCTIVLTDPAGGVSVSVRLLSLVAAVDAAAAAVAVAGRVRDATE